eukprot:6201078-Pleurochrysis_carterae.AAC.1
MGGRDHDFTRLEVGEKMIGWVHAGRFHAFFAALPCESFSVAHIPQLCTRMHPTGVTPLLKRWARYLAKYNLLADFTAQLITAAHAAEVFWAIENPADCGEVRGVAWWPRFASHPPVTFAQCALGAAVRKSTTIATAPGMRVYAGRLVEAQCTHGTGAHGGVAHGRDADGAPQARAAAAYPAEMNAAIADMTLH